jgi:imidazolonepropionase-like amidohydrolase
MASSHSSLPGSVPAPPAVPAAFRRFLCFLAAVLLPGLLTPPDLLAAQAAPAGPGLDAGESVPASPEGEGARLSLPAPADADAWAFVGVTVVPMDRDVTLPGHTVVVRDGRIAAMGPSGTVAVPDDAQVIEGRGRYLLPGLAEMHAHVPGVPDPPREVVEETLFLFLSQGVTTIRGMLGQPYQLELREEIRRGEVAGPDFYVGAPSINGNSAPTPEAADSLVRAHAAAGYDFLKIHPGVPLDAWNRMVEVAEEVGITFAGHVPADVGIFHAIRTGMATVDHLDGFFEVTRRQGADGDDPVALLRATDEEALDALTRELAERGVWLVPTQYLWNHLRGYVDPDAILALPEFRYVSPQVRQSWRQRAEANRANPDITPASHQAHAEMRQQFLSTAHRNGVPILLGTDSPQVFNVPGFAMHHEIVLMRDAGMSPWEILASGSREVARYVEESLEQPGDFGTVVEGNRANLILVRGNPLDDLAALQDPAGVMFQGRWLDADAIARGLDAIARRHAGQ